MPRSSSRWKTTRAASPAPYHAEPLLEISRRIDRGEGSTYRINGSEVRARDVQLLFADASTGANSPALVRQGQISELIGARPQNRRRILEEAAGVSGLLQPPPRSRAAGRGRGDQSHPPRRCGGGAGWRSGATAARGAGGGAIQEARRARSAVCAPPSPTPAGQGGRRPPPGREAWRAAETASQSAVREAAAAMTRPSRRPAPAAPARRAGRRRDGASARGAGPRSDRARGGGGQGAHREPLIRDARAPRRRSGA